MNAMRRVFDKSEPVRDHPTQPTIKKIRKRIPLLLTGYFFGHIARNIGFVNCSGPAMELDMKPVKRFPDYKFGSLIGRKERAKLNLETDLHKKDNSSRIITGLWAAYTSYDYGYAAFPLAISER